jgi:hypothetical protein
MRVRDLMNYARTPGAEIVAVIRLIPGHMMTLAVDLEDFELSVRIAETSGEADSYPDADSVPFLARWEPEDNTLYIGEIADAEARLSDVEPVW